ncbi:hypothetical protein [Streptomyces zaomyceticus]|uniref:hypothetical protein n=1 Tax=Streptomyces zaomyceticus TaxID=68286 RepID=UPI001E3703E3
MSAWVPSSAMAASIEITAATVQRGDVIQIGGQPCRVADLFHMPGGAKRLHFESGELLTLHARSRLIALRMQRVGDQRRGFAPTRHRR